MKRLGKINTITHEADDVIFIINSQIGNNKYVVQREFLQCKNGPYLTYFNAESSRAAGVGITIRLCSDSEIISLVSFYDTNENII